MRALAGFVLALILAGSADAQSLAFFGRGAASTPTAPAPPTLSIGAGNAQNTLSWVDGSNGGSAITGHSLYRGLSSGSETLLATFSSASPYADTGLTNGTQYFYYLKATNAIGTSVASNEVSGTPSASGVGQLDFSNTTNSGLLGAI